jgi:hypothetical protein
VEAPGMKRGRNTLALVAIAAALGAYIYFIERKREPASDTATPNRGKVFTVDASKIEEVQIKNSGGDRTILRKANNAWQITAPAQVPADETEASGIATNLSTLELQRVVEEKPKDLAAYGLATPRVEVAFTAAGEKTPRQLLIGEKTPTGGDLYAKTADNPRVFLIAGYLDGTFDRSTFQLREKSVLKFDREKVDRISVDANKTSFQAVKKADAWTITQPWQARADVGTVESLLSRLSSGQMKSLVSPEPKSLKEHGLEPPVTRIVLGSGSSQAGLLLGKPTPEGDLYAKDVARAAVFTVEKTLAEDLTKPPADFRAKDVFGFRAFTGNRLEVTRAGNTVAFEKRKGQEKEALEKWTQVQPAKQVDAAKIEDLITKVAGLRAESFTDSLPAGAELVATIATKFDENKKQETVALHKAGESYFATRSDDSGAAKLTSTEVEDVLKALDGLK